MSENTVLSEIEAAAVAFKICVLPRNPKTLSCSVWSMPDPGYHVGVIWRQNTGAAKYDHKFVRFGMPGDADFTGWLFTTGYRIDIEAKKPSEIGLGRAETGFNVNQAARHKLAFQTGVLSGLARSYDDAVSLFESWGLRRPS